MILVASDMDRTISSEKDDFYVRDEVSEKINEFCKANAFLVVTGREEKYAKLLASKLEPTGWVIENGAIIHINGQKVINVPEEWRVERERVIKELKNRGLNFSLGEQIVYVNGIKEELILTDGASVEYNRGDAMIMPVGVNKGTGLLKAIKLLNFDGITIGVGDGENDHKLFDVVDIRVAVANAVPSLKERADHVLSKEDGEGIIELLELVRSEDFLKKLNVSQ